MDNPSTGQCLCGAVSFRISGSFDSFFLCHCARCRKGSGSAHAAKLFASGASLIWVSGADRIQHFVLPRTRHAKSFCKTCGSALPYTSKDSGMLVVPAGCLDTPVGLRPDAHICHASRADWDDALDTIEKIDGLPG